MKVKRKKPVTMRTIARRLLDLFGVDGEHWIEGDYNDGDGNYCLIGGIDKLRLSNKRNMLSDAIAEYDPDYKANHDGVESWNDYHQWADIKKFLMRYAHPYQPKPRKEKVRAAR